MDTPRLSSPRLIVSMSDGAEIEVQTLNADLIRYDLTRGKHGWPDGTKAPFLWLTFIAWAAMRREHMLTEDVTWERFSGELCVSVSSMSDDDDEQIGRGLPFSEDQGLD